MRLAPWIVALAACEADPRRPPEPEPTGDPCAEVVSDLAGGRVLRAAAALSRPGLVVRCGEAQRAVVVAAAVAMLDDDQVLARHGTAVLTRATVATEVLATVTGQPRGPIVEPPRALEAGRPR